MESGKYSKALSAVIVFVFFYVNGVARVAGQTATQSMSTAEIAAGIAQTIDANTARSLNGPLEFLSASARDNVVEVSYLSKDAAFFAANKTNVDKSRIAMLRYYCSPSRLAYINQGIVFRIIFFAPNKADRIEITADQESCAHRQTPKLADRETLARIARSVAAKEEMKSTTPTDKLFLSISASAREGAVKLNSIVVNSPAWSDTLKRRQILGIMLGYFCEKYGEEIAQGLSIQENLSLANGSPVANLAVDGSSCGSKASK